MKKKILIGSLITVVLLSMIGVSVYREVYAQGPIVKVMEVKQDEISSYLMVPGSVALEEEQAVYLSPERGTLKDILVEEGQSIKKGTVLAKFENAQLQLEAEQNTLSLESNNMKITQLKKQLSDLEKQETELSSGLLPDPAAEAQITGQISQVEMELKVAELELKQANLQKESIEKRTGELEIKSTIDGMVLLVDESASLSAAAGAQPIVLVGKMEGLIAKGLLSEYDTLKVSVGQKVILRSDAVPDQNWPGEVTKVSTLPDSQAAMAGSQAVQYPVLVKLSGKNPVLKPGFQVIMEIETEKKTAIVLPESAIVDEEDAQYVYVVKKGIAHKKEVKTGIMTGSKVEITEGVKEKDKVIANPPAKMKDGMEVTVK
ncbi:efflux RND transporter periplasmic adaptor subunit [Neobacillus notoginsengisoli]|uniref:Efflux RND transporter periplasmic adaptor subunit n=1 Tax=Neobacillus notoginsengisoli TaxID=1578198 RepID=A0A417YVW1_9BACI|nr:efflux RND transporter periplasmic adaptor subunit [Neobacillus notoginsengisoli]RHW41522.1 efflux RND transporter periplasmic adaptor subunit [Neobacillus notoginsengisoli]